MVEMICLDVIRNIISNLNVAREPKKEADLLDDPRLGEKHLPNSFKFMINSHINKSSSSVFYKGQKLDLFYSQVKLILISFQYLNIKQYS